MKAISDRFGVRVEHGIELISCKSMDDKVIAHIQTINSDGTKCTESAEAEYLVGTDGGRSRVRNELGLAFDGQTLPGVVIIGDIRVGGVDPFVSPTYTSAYYMLTAYSDCSYLE
jgi:2-polyprenyl-6-methoxyphenol hydroxylase-like FAD-dependent oxidoreductase